MFRVKIFSLLLAAILFAGAFPIAAQTPTPNAAIENFVVRLLAAKTEAERAAIVDAQTEIAPAEFRKLLVANADALRTASKLDDAIVVFRAAQTVAEKLNDNDGIAEALSRQGAVYRFKGDYDRAMEFLEPALKRYQSSGSNAGIGMVLNNVGAVHYFRGDYQKAEEIWRQGLAAREKTGIQKEINQSLNNLGALYTATGKIDDALEVFKRILASSRELKDDYQLAAALNNIGDILSEQGDYRRAMEFLLEALEVNEKRGDKLDSSLVLNNIGQVYYSQANYERAALYYERARRLREEVGDQQGLAVTLMHLGMVRAANDEYAAALDLVKQSLALREKIGDKRGIAIALNNLGRIELRANHTGAALEFFNKSLAQYETSQYKDGIAQTLNNIARAQLDLGNALAASEAATRAVALARETGARETLWLALSILGQAQRALGQGANAEKTLRESIAVVETVRGQVTGDALDRQQFFQDKIAPYHLLVEMLVGAGKADEALQFAERAKGRVLLDVLQTGQNTLDKNLSEEERKEEKNLKSAVFVLENDLRRAAAKPNFERAALAGLQTKLDRTRAALDSFTNTLYAKYPELKLQRGETKIADTAALKSLLPDSKTALIEYVATEKRTFIFVVTSDKTNPKTEVFPIEIGREDLAKTITAFREKLARRDLRFNDDAKKIYNLLLAPVARQLENKNRLIVAPDAALWELPFQALVDPKNKYVVESAAVSYAPSLSVLAGIGRKQSSSSTESNIIAFGNPAHKQKPLSVGKNQFPVSMSDTLADLPEAKKQVEALSALYGAKRSLVFTGEKATETEFKKSAANFKILHLATHGILDNASPLYSYVLLSKNESDGEDGRLEAWELMQMNLNADLVVLSACESGRGRIGAGEGLVGLTWAFFVAGSPTTIASQWKVESASTTTLMLGFYQRLQDKSVSKAENLRQSSLALLKNEKYAHPFYWAGFVIVGDGR